MDETNSLGASYLGEGRCAFVLWAPAAGRVEVHLVAPEDRIIPMERGERGYHHAIAGNIAPGALYLYRLDGDVERPDPASRRQPQGVHGPSCVADPRFDWSDGNWTGLALRDYILYELHVGTFTAEGTFDAAVSCLDELRDLGVTALELMPVAQFPGSRNWGYDGVFPFAVQDSYGGPDGLKRLVDACHREGIAVVLDVVYNHLGPEGNVLGSFGPYFIEYYGTPWGKAINYDGPGSDEVRRFFIENALTWVQDFHVDALRLDAVHGIIDLSACPFLEELGAAVHATAARLCRPVHLIAESNLNAPRFIRPAGQGGCGLDGIWNDDFHHALHAILTGERERYYIDFGRFDQLKKAYSDGFVYDGNYSVFHGHRHGRPLEGAPGESLIVFSQTHDQVGNRARGDRLAERVSLEALKLTAAAVLLSPFTPLLFMGEEYGETSPFPYFISHSDTGLIEATRKGRLAEFPDLKDAAGIPDPQAEATFLAAKLRWGLRSEGSHGVLLSYYREVLQLRKMLLQAGCLQRERMEVLGFDEGCVLRVRYPGARREAALVIHLGKKDRELSLPLPAGTWHRILDSAQACWGGPGGALPATIESGGTCTLSLAGESAVLLLRAKGGV
ncbi:MAG: malto-oligosyltrehalose trehalohydrolase [Syntrophaceae bacterium]